MTESTLSAIRAEVEQQPAKLGALLSNPVEPAASGSIFVGAGDSYAASLSAFYLSAGKFLALDPYAIMTMPATAAGRDVFFISVSGRTSSNVAAARKLRGVAGRRIAITANRGSPLAQEVDEILFLPYEVRPRVPGTLSFTLSLLTALKLALGDFSCDFRRAYSMAKSRQRKVALSESGITYFLGNNAIYAGALYASAKLHEVLGARSQPQLLEEFSHMELFSLRNSDSIVIFSAFDPAGVGEKLYNALRSKGYLASLLEPYNSNVVESLFYYVFLSQLSVLAEARRRKLSQPFLAGATKMLEMSDRMIY